MARTFRLALAFTVAVLQGGCTLVGFEPISVSEGTDPARESNGTPGLRTGGLVDAVDPSGGIAESGGTAESGGSLNAGGGQQVSGGAETDVDPASGSTVDTGGAGMIAGTGGSPPGMLPTGGSGGGVAEMTGGTPVSGDLVSGGSDATGGSFSTGGVAPTPFVGVSLLHRYDFSGTGTVVPDLVGFADAHLKGGATLSGSGAVTLDGVSGYLQLPPRATAGSGSRSYVLWVDVEPGNCNTHLIDFGNSSNGWGQAGTPTSSLFAEAGDCYAASASTTLAPRMGYITEAGLEQSTGSLGVGSGPRLIAITFDAVNGELRYYADLNVINTRSAPRDLLENLDDQNNWLGRSQRSGDPYFQGTLEEFRIYDGLIGLDDLSIEALINAGPDVALP